MDSRGRISKSAILIHPDGTRQRYVKTRLVPFGEYIPFRSAFGWLSRVSRAAGQDRVPGTGPLTMRLDGTTVGPLICFESAFPDLGREVTNLGAQVLVYQSSTSSFQQSWAPPQHASLAAVRAAETGRPAVQAALTGVSAAPDRPAHVPHPLRPVRRLHPLPLDRHSRGDSPHRRPQGAADGCRPPRALRTGGGIARRRRDRCPSKPGPVARNFLIATAT
jgi:predicted amidohydrolase